MEALAEQVLAGTMGTVMLRGAPGTGKTILAQELLRIKGRGTYISTKVPRRGKRELGANAKEEIVLEEVCPALAPGRGPTPELGPRKRAHRVLELVAASIQRRARGMIVIDSWETIARGLNSAERWEIEQRLVGMVEASDSMMVIINDESSEESLGFIVDGIIELKRTLHQGATLRILEIKKLSQMPALQPLHLFTLAGGRFKMFGPPRTLFPGQYAPHIFQPIPDPEGGYSTAIPDLDRLSGGVPRGTSMTIELGDGFSLALVLPLHLMAMANFVQNGGCVVGLPTSGSPPEALLEPLRAILPPRSAESSVRLGYYRAYDDACTFLLNINSIEQTFQKLWQQVAEMKGPKQRPCYIFIGVEKLEHIHGEKDVLKDIVVSLSRIRSNKDMFTVFVDSTTASRKALSAMTNTHFAIENRFNVLTFQLLKPKAPIHVVDYDYSRGYPQASLTPVL